MLRPAEDRTADLLVGPKAAGEGAIKAWDTAREPSVSTAKVFIVMVEVGRRLRSVMWWVGEGAEQECVQF